MIRYVETMEGVPNDVACKVMEYAIRKLAVIKQPLTYLPTLFMSELHDYYMRRSINAEGGSLHVPAM